jgi:hypothetical protein
LYLSDRPRRPATETGTVGSQPAAGSGLGRYAAYAALALTVLGLPLISISDPRCEFVGSATQDYTGQISEPGNTGGVLAFALAPLIALAALVSLVRAGRRASRLALPRRSSSSRLPF